MKIAIIGAGIAGLSAAHELRDSLPNADVILFDKSRGVGGRMSTRYADAWEFDHGAQYFTAEDAGFRSALDVAIDVNAVAPWDGRAVYLKTGLITADTGKPRFVGTPRMNSLPKFWAEGLNIQTGRRIAKVIQSGAGYDLLFEDSSRETGFDAVISTMPPAQAKDVVPSDFAEMDAVKSAKMSACFALMIGLSSPVDPGWDTLRISDLPVCWISINHAKPARSGEVGTIVVHSAPEWSDEHADADRDWVQSVMLDCASALMGLPLENAPHMVLHRWLYASVETSPNQPCLLDGKLVAAGDWCLGGRVEGAWLSGRAAARAILG